MLQKLTSFTKEVSQMADQPSGTPAEIKAQFDAAPEELRQYFNNLIDALKSTASSDSGAKNIGATPIADLTGSDIQSLLESIKTLLDKKLDDNGDRIQYGTTGTLTIPANHDWGFTFTFPNQFTTVPFVFLQATGGDATTAYYLYPVVNSITTKDFKIDVNNGAGVTGYIKYNWIAIGKE